MGVKQNFNRFKSLASNAAGRAIPGQSIISMVFPTSGLPQTRARMSNHGEGILTGCPTFIRFGSSIGFTAMSASSLTPYFLAMDVGVSPALTAYERIPEPDRVSLSKA